MEYNFHGLIQKQALTQSSPKFRGRTTACIRRALLCVRSMVKEKVIGWVMDEELYNVTVSLIDGMQNRSHSMSQNRSPDRTVNQDCRESLIHMCIYF